MSASSKSLSSVTPKKTAPRPKRQRRTENDIEIPKALDPAKAPGGFDAIPRFVTALKSSKLYKTTDGMLLIDCIARKLYGDRESQGKRAPRALTDPITNADLAEACHSTPTTMTTLTNWLEAQGVLLKVDAPGRAFQFAFRLDKYVQQPDGSYEWQCDVFGAAPAPKRDKTEDPDKADDGVPRHTMVVLPGRGVTMPLGQAIDFHRLKPNEPVNIDCQSDLPISFSAALDGGRISLRIAEAEVGSRKPTFVNEARSNKPSRKPTFVNVDDDSLQTLENWLEGYGADATLKAVAERLKDSGVPVDFYCQVGETEVASMKLKRKPIVEGFFVAHITAVAEARWGKEVKRREHAARKPNAVDTLPWQVQADVAMLRHTLEHGEPSDRELARETLESLGVAV